MGAFNKPILGEAAVMGFTTSILKGKGQIKSATPAPAAPPQRRLPDAPKSTTNGLK